MTPADQSADGFLDVLFGASALEDLAQYKPESLKTLARDALARLSAPRRPGRAEIRLIDPVSDDPALSAVTIVEVVNDDLPFLLDSTLVELAARGLELRLVAHPILAVQRDSAGRLRRVGEVAHVDGVPGLHPAQRLAGCTAGLAVHGGQYCDLGNRSLHSQSLGHRRVEIVVLRGAAQ